MGSRFLNIGYGNLVLIEKIVAIVKPTSSPIKKVRTEARKSGRLIDATFGRKTRSVIFMESEHIILSALKPETIMERVEEKTFKD